MMSPEDSPSLPSTITEGFLLQESNPNHNPNSSNPSLKRKRNLPGNPDPDAEVIALSPKSLMATNRFLCEICNKGFQRDQNLQLHRRGHKLPWKLKQRNKLEVIQKKVYVCPEESCVHHEPSRALGDLTGIKKHFSRKHGEKTWNCDKCSKKYAVKSDWKAHSKICGTREYRCDCGTLFSRKDSFVTHRAFCDALTAEQGARFGSTSNIATNFVNMPSFMNAAFTSNNPHHHQARNIPQFLPNFQPHQISAPNLGLPEMTQTSSMDMFGPSSSHNQWLNKFQETTSFANGNISMPILVSRGLKEEEHSKGNLGLSEPMNSSSFYDSNPSPNHMSAQMAFTIANNNNNNENINVLLDSISCASQMGDVGSSSLFSASKSNSFMGNNKMNHMSQMMSLCPLGNGSSSGTMSEMEKNRLTRDFLGVSGVTSLPFFQQELDGARLASMGSAMDQLSQFSSRTSDATQQ